MYVIPSGGCSAHVQLFLRISGNMRFDNVVFEASCGLKSQLLHSDVGEVVFSGRSNVGKSSLINKLVNRKSIARVSSTPGKTATINFYRLDSARFVDLPGYGYAKVSHSERERWAELVEGYFSDKRNITLLVQLVDMRHKPTVRDFEMIEYLKCSGVRFIVVLTKSDKLNKTERNESLMYFQGEPRLAGVECISFSTITGEGVYELRSAITQAVERRGVKGSGSNDDDI